MEQTNAPHSNHETPHNPPIVQTPSTKKSFFETYQNFFAIIIVGILILAGILIAHFTEGGKGSTSQQENQPLTQSQVRDGLVKVAKDLKLDKKAFATCLDNGTYKNLIASDVKLAQDSGVQGTPTFFILNRTLNADGSVKSTKQFEILGARDEATFLKSVADGKAPADQPEQPAGQKVALSDSDHYMGPKDAKVVIVEYSDIECPYCKAEKPVIDTILKNHPEYGFVYRHSPIASLHPWAEYKAEGSECAFAQGGDTAFWKYLDETVK
ncbi:MAG: Sodium/proton antiporter [Patescibacteria group bacterium]|nr:Sodium/proton antiporter [Patescibacteria group bacterium]